MLSGTKRRDRQQATGTFSCMDNFHERLSKQTRCGDSVSPNAGTGTISNEGDVTLTTTADNPVLGKNTSFVQCI
jgi:hypothetical protein